MKMIIELSEEDYLDILYYLVDKDQCFAYSDYRLREIIRNGSVVSEHFDGSLITLEGKRVMKRMEVDNDKID